MPKMCGSVTFCGSWAPSTRTGSMPAAIRISSGV
jgi:hypothetical protein